MRGAVFVFLACLAQAPTGWGRRSRSAWCFQAPIEPQREVLAGCQADLATLLHRDPQRRLNEQLQTFYCQCQKQLRDGGYELCKAVAETGTSWCCGPLKCRDYFTGATNNATLTAGWPPNCGPPNAPVPFEPSCGLPPITTPLPPSRKRNTQNRSQVPSTAEADVEESIEVNPVADMLPQNSADGIMLSMLAVLILATFNVLMIC